MIGEVEQPARPAVLAVSHPDAKDDNQAAQAMRRCDGPAEIDEAMHRVKYTVRDYSGVASGNKTALHALDLPAHAFR